MPFWKRLDSATTQAPVIVGVPGLPVGQPLVGTVGSRGRLLIVAPYDHASMTCVDQHARMAMRYLGIFEHAA